MGVITKMISYKKDYLFIVLVFISIVGLAVLASSHHQRLATQYPDQLVELASADFTLEKNTQAIQVGQSSWDEVRKIYPQGKILGMSSVYRPEGQAYVLTFTEKSNVLTKVDITGPGLNTSRGIAVNDSFAKVVAAYGEDYIKSYLKNDPEIFDAIYGSQQNIVFHVSDDIVQRIVIEYPLVDKDK